MINDCTSEGARAPFAVSIRVRQIHGSWSCNADRAGARPYHWSSRTPPGAASSAPPLPLSSSSSNSSSTGVDEDADEFEDDYD